MISESKGIYIGSAKTVVISGVDNKTDVLLIFVPEPGPSPCPCCCCCCQQKFPFYGTVYDRYSGLPVEEATITVNSEIFKQSQLTDSNGNFRFELPLRCNEINVSLVKSGFVKRYISSYRVKACEDNNFYIFR